MTLLLHTEDLARQAIASLRAESPTWDELVATYGTPYNIPREIVTERQERQRLIWVEHVTQRDGTAPTDKHDKTDKIRAFVEALPPGIEVTVDVLAGAAGASAGTAHRFISNNRSMFVAVADKRGTYTVADVAAERAAAGRPVAPVPSSVASGATNADDDLNDISATLASFTGHDKDDAS